METPIYVCSQASISASPNFSRTVNLVNSSSSQRALVKAAPRSHWGSLKRWDIVLRSNVTFVGAINVCVLRNDRCITWCALLDFSNLPSQVFLITSRKRGFRGFLGVPCQNWSKGSHFNGLVRWAHHGPPHDVNGAFVSKTPYSSYS